MEIGSFIELQFRKGLEYYKGDDVARLNSGRAAIYHAVRCFYSQTVWLPYYECDTVRDFLINKGLRVKYYYIDKDFTPMIDSISPDESIVIVNYFGIMSNARMMIVASRYHNVIIDNAISEIKESIRQGENIAIPLSRYDIFPPMFIQMVNVGEKSGSLDVILSKVSDFYDSEISHSIDILMTILEPMMLLLVAGMVAFVVIAMYLPMFKIYQFIT